MYPYLTPHIHLQFPLAFITHTNTPKYGNSSWRRPSSLRQSLTPKLSQCRHWRWLCWHLNPPKTNKISEIMPHWQSDYRTFLTFGAQAQETRFRKGTVTLVGHFIYEKNLTTSRLFCFFKRNPTKKKCSEERTGSASPVPNLHTDSEKSELYTMFIIFFPNLNRGTFGGGFFCKNGRIFKILCVLTLIGQLMLGTGSFCPNYKHTPRSQF